MGKILIADDDPDVLRLIRGVFEHHDHQVMTTTQPAEVTDLLDENPIDAVVLDLKMPEISGWDLLKEIRARPRWRTLPVLLLSGVGQISERVRGFKEGADDFLAKPFETSELLARVERLVDRRRGEVGLEGNLESFTPGDVAQNLTQGNKTGCLRITGESQLVEVYFLEGRILRANAGKLEGVDAILTLLDLDAGHFVFEATSQDVAQQNDDGRDLQINSIFLEAAWLEDEILRRREDLPSPTQRLRVRGAAPITVPEEFDVLPLDLIHRTIEAKPDIDLHSLTEMELTAPSRLLLSLAVLLEQGDIEAGAEPTGPVSTGVPTSPSAPAPSATATSATATSAEPPRASHDPLKRLIEACAARGNTSSTLQALILFQPAAWNTLLTVVASIPEELLGEPRHQLLEKLNEHESGTVRLSHGSGNVLLNLKPLRDGKLQGGALLALAAGIILWLPDVPEDAVLKQYVAKLVTASDRSVGAILLPTEVPPPPLGSLLADTGRWRLATTPPRDLGDLVDLLT